VSSPSVRRAYRIIIRSLKDFYHDSCGMYAGALAYFFIVSIVPFFILAVMVLGYLLGESRAFFDYLLDELIGFFPDNARIVAIELKKVISFKGVGTVSLVIYTIVSYQFYHAMQDAIQVIFKVQIRRPLVYNVLISLVAASVFVFFMFFSFSLTTAVPILGALERYVDVPQLGTIKALLLQYVVPLFMVFVAVTFMYIVVPRRRVYGVHAVWGGLFTAVMLEVSKHVFTYYVINLRNIGAVYGSLSAFVIFFLWVYVSAAIFLVGGEIVHALGQPFPEIPNRRYSDPYPDMEAPSP
jgi:membrane protein